jgi:hypothetical protein
MFGKNLRGPAALAAVSLALQACLACHWLTSGVGLFQQDGRPGLWKGCVWSYNSYYPGALKNYLPYCQPFVEFWRHPANLSAVLLAAGLLTSGYFFRKRTVAVGSLMAAVCFAVSLVAVAPVKPCPAACAGPEAWGAVGRLESKCRVARPALDEQGVLAQTPPWFPAPGAYRVVVDYRADDVPHPVGYVMFHDGQNLNPLSPLMGDGRRPQQSISTLTVPRRASGRQSSVLVWYGGDGALGIARLSIEKIDR